MMKFMLDGASVSIKFKFQDAVTICYFIVDNWVFSGSALCSSNDQFNKETGRKISLRRALANAGVDKAHRAAIWLKYLTRNDISDDAAFVLAYVPEADSLSFEDAWRLAHERNRLAARQLEMDFRGPHGK